MQKEQHGKRSTSTYNVWSNMRQRCNNPSTPAYKNYGGRGIKVCPEWDSSFAQFLADMGDRPTGKQLNRIDNDGDYTPDNCEWTTPSKNARNKRTNAIYEYGGEIKTLADWSEDSRCAVSYTTLRKRVRDGWDFAEALTSGRMRPHQRKTHCVNGHEFSDETTVVYSGARVCVQCHRDRSIKAYWKGKPND